MAVPKASLLRSLVRALPPSRSLSSSSFPSASGLGVGVGIGVGGAEVCGRGDKKTQRGKRFLGKFGNSRPKREERIRRIKERWELPPGTPWPVPGLAIESYRYF